MPLISLNRYRVIPGPPRKPAMDYGLLVNGDFGASDPKNYQPDSGNNDVNNPFDILFELPSTYTLEKIRWFQNNSSAQFTLFAGTTPYAMTQIGGTFSVNGGGSADWDEVFSSLTNIQFVRIIMTTPVASGRFPAEFQVWGNITGAPYVQPDTDPIIYPVAALTRGVNAHPGGNDPVKLGAAHFKAVRLFFDIPYAIKLVSGIRKARFDNSYGGGVSDSKMLAFKSNGVDHVHLCLQYSDDSIKNVDATTHNNGYKPIAYNADSRDVNAYINIATAYKWVSRYYGHGTGPASDIPLDFVAEFGHTQPNHANIGAVDSMESWNETNKTWNSTWGYYSPEEYATFLSAAYDGHEGTLGDIGIKAGDPNMLAVMAGTVIIDIPYIQRIALWGKFNRTDGKFPADVLNFHEYCNNGTVGISPEEFGIRAKVSEVVNYRNTYLKNLKIWFTETGYDTNNSNQHAPAIGSWTKEDVQGIWSIRLDLEIDATGVDKVFYFTFTDEPNQTDSTTDTYYKSGLVTSEITSQALKKSYYWKQGFQSCFVGSTLRYKSRIDDVVVTQTYEDNDGNLLIVIWSPTSNNTIEPDHVVAHPPGTWSSCTKYSFRGNGGRVSSGITLAEDHVDTITEAPIAFYYVNSTPGEDVTNPTTPSLVSFSAVTNTTADVLASGSTDDTGVTKYEYFVDGVSRGEALIGVKLAITGLTAGTTYQITARSFDAAGHTSAQSAQFALVTSSSDTTNPSSATLAVSRITHNSVRAHWSAATDNAAVASYNLYDDSDNLLFNVVGLFKDITGLLPSTQYLFKIKAVDSSGNLSTNFTSVKFKTIAAPATNTLDIATQSGISALLNKWWSPRTLAIAIKDLFQLYFDNRKTVVVPDYQSLRMVTAKAGVEYRINHPDFAGSWYLDIADNTTLDNIGTVLVTDSGQRLKRLVENGVVLSSWFGLVADGDATLPTDNLRSMGAFLQAGENKKILFNKKGSYLTSAGSSIGGSLDIDLCGSTIMTPNGWLIQPSSNITQHNLGGYFQAEKGQSVIDMIPGVIDETTLKVGMVMRLSTNSFRVLNYRDGMYVVVRHIDTDNDKIHLSDGFYESFMVDRIWFKAPIDVSIVNGTLDARKCVVLSQIITGNHFHSFTMKNVRMFGSDYSQAGALLKGYKIDIQDCEAYNFLNIQGISGGGRTGYGFGTNGTHVFIRAKTINCKHGITGNDREFFSVNLILDNCRSENPKESWNRQLTSSPSNYNAKDWEGNSVQVKNLITTNNPLMQGQYDAHGSVYNFYVNDCETWGCNCPITPRGENTFIKNPVFFVDKVNTSFSTDFLINSSETPFNMLRVDNPTVIGIETEEAAGPTLVGIQGYAGSYGSVIINNPNMKGGRLFVFKPSSSAATSSATTLDELIIRGIKGEGHGLVSIQNTSAAPLGKIGYIEIEGHFVQSDKYGPLTEFINLSYINRIDYIKLSGVFDGRVRNAPLIKLIAPAAFQAPELDFRGSEFHAGSRVIEIQAPTVVSTAGTVFKKAQFDGCKFYYNYAQVDINSEGTYFNLVDRPSGEWTWKDAKFFNQDPTPNSTSLKNIYFFAECSANFDGVVLDGTLLMNNTTYFKAMLAAGIVPSIKSRNLTSPWVIIDNKKYRCDGRVYIQLSRQTNAGTSKAIPGDLVDYVGQEVFNDSWTSVNAPYSWIGITAGQSGITGWRPVFAREFQTDPEIESRSEFFNDFFNPGNASCDEPFVAVVNGTGAATTNVLESLNGRMGIKTFNTGTTAGGYAGLNSGINTFIAGGGEIMIKGSFQVPVLSTSAQKAAFVIGMGDKHDTIDQVDGLYFVIDSDSNANFQCKSAKNSTLTVVDSGIAAVAGTWYDIKIVCASTTSALFYIKVGGAADYTLVATITTNIPDGIGRSSGVIASVLKSVGTTDFKVYVDYLYARKNYNTIR